MNLQYSFFPIFFSLVMLNCTVFFFHYIPHFLHFGNFSHCTKECFMPKRLLRDNWLRLHPYWGTAGWWKEHVLISVFPCPHVWVRSIWRESVALSSWVLATLLGKFYVISFVGLRVASSQLLMVMRLTGAEMRFKDQATFNRAAGRSERACLWSWTRPVRPRHWCPQRKHTTCALPPPA